MFAISAPDFDQVCQAACLDAIRDPRPIQAIRRGPGPRRRTTPTAARRPSARPSTTYGVEIQRVGHHQRPAACARSWPHASRAAWPPSSATSSPERHALEERLQQRPRRPEATAHRGAQSASSSQAANEALRLRLLEERSTRIPTRSGMTSISGGWTWPRPWPATPGRWSRSARGGDVADALVVHTLTDDQVEAPPTRRPRKGPPTGT